jgi:hypothetical protein
MARHLQIKNPSMSCNFFLKIYVFDNYSYHYTLFKSLLSDFGPKNFIPDRVEELADAPDQVVGDRHSPALRLGRTVP